ncbi:hypothetical protein DFH08DRAFT_845657 [Mycena albidolilacea]|uniref:Uncharacterized protein n=1 Tax=Mycena albidolilacea TaxID=1033008 RepID=A0AAD7AHT4_9AGAR|nr:hypothetical protein DFH08DRAFT_845657 [Mycena albidolilacea]
MVMRAAETSTVRRDSSVKDFSLAERQKDFGLSGKNLGLAERQKDFGFSGENFGCAERLKDFGLAGEDFGCTEGLEDGGLANYESLGTLKRHTLDSNPDIHEENGKGTNELHVVFNGSGQRKMQFRDSSSLLTVRTVGAFPVRIVVSERISDRRCNMTCSGQRVIQRCRRSFHNTLQGDKTEDEINVSAERRLSRWLRAIGGICGKFPLSFGDEKRRID